MNTWNEDEHWGTIEDSTDEVDWIHEYLWTLDEVIRSFQVMLAGGVVYGQWRCAL